MVTVGLWIGRWFGCAIARMLGSGHVVLCHRSRVDQVCIGSPVGQQTRAACA